MIKLLSLFSGIGAFESALHRGGYDFTLVNYCEIDKYASKAYSQIHEVSEDLNLRDVTKVDTAKLPKDLDLITYGFPCTDISIAGRKKGFFNENGNPTRSGLFYDALKIIRDLQPKYAIAENVKNLTGKKFKEEFKSVLDGLTDAGYNNYWQVLNAKDYGIPQNRERIFIISIRKDIDTGTFTFPKKQPLQLRLKDLLQQEVEEKYYIKKAVNTRIADNYIQYDNSGKGYNSQSERLYYQDGLCPTIPTSNNNGDKTQIILMDKETVIQHAADWTKNKQVDMNSYINEIISKNIETPVGIDEQNVKVRTDGLVGTIMTNGSSAKKNNRICCTDFRIRKLTPRECFRLMGFTDEEFDRIHNISNTQLYKQAGNSIVVNVLTAIFNELFNQNSVFQLE